MVAIVLQDELVIPPGIDSLGAFRRWTLSDDFPTTGRIDFIDGQIEVDMAPERIYSHSIVVMEIGRVVATIVKAKSLGHTLSGHTRVFSDRAGLSCEPDISFVSWESLKSGRVRYLQAPRPAHELDMLEVEGGPDLVVEVISPTSIRKDTTRLHSAYFNAGVREYWLVDARSNEVSFQIFRRTKNAFKLAPKTSRGFYASDVLGYDFRLVRSPGSIPNTFDFTLESHAR